MDTTTEFHVEVVRVGDVAKHPNADTLSVTQVRGYPVIIKTGAFAAGDLAVYVPVDAVVDVSRPEFAFLGKRNRIRAMRLRGVFSMGLLVPAQPGWIDGQNVEQEMGVRKYEPEVKLRGAPLPKGVKPAAKSFMPVYGVEALRRNPDLLRPGEEVVLTEKVHGCNARYCYRGGRLHVGSHKALRGASAHWLSTALERLRLRVLRWAGRPRRTDLIERAGDVWWEIADRYDLRAKLSSRPEMVVYGEVYGPGVQDLEYGLVRRALLVFDVFDLRAGSYLSHDELVDFCRGLDLPMPPILFRGPWSDELRALAEGASTLPEAKHIREGFVARPIVERGGNQLSGTPRAIVKFVGQGYLLREAA